MSGLLSALNTSATITFERFLDPNNLGVDPRSGVQTGAKEEITLVAYLREDNSAAALNQLLEQFGRTDNAKVLRGRLIDPVAMPTGLQPGARGSISFGLWTGRFILGTTLPDVASQFVPDLGQKISGIMQISGTFGDAT